MSYAAGTVSRAGGPNAGGLMPSEVRFPVLRRMLESNGWALVRVSGSHHVFKKPGSPDVVLPVHRGKVKPYYVRQVEKLVKED